MIKILITLYLIFTISGCKQAKLNPITPLSPCNSYLAKGVAGDHDYQCLYDGNRKLRWLQVS
jgi:hypothetical protein